MRRIQSHFEKYITSDIKECNWYFAGLGILLSAALLLLALTGKAGSFLSLNSYHPFLLNVFFINYTFLGDGIFAFCLIGYFFYRKRKDTAFALLLSFLLSGFIVQLIKNFVSAPRPKIFFENGQYLHFIDGVSHGGYSSFPSGHTATAFAIATVVVLMMKNKAWQIFILTAAALVGYSRIYLAQHFLIDVIIGSLIGSVAGILSIYLIGKAAGYKRAVHQIQSEKGNSSLPAHSTIQTG